MEEISYKELKKSKKGKLYTFFIEENKNFKKKDIYIL